MVENVLTKLKTRVITLVLSSAFSIRSSLDSQIPFLLFATVFFGVTLVPSMSSTEDTDAAGTGGTGANNSTPIQACAACRHQRRKCQNCPLSPYFPPTHTQQFLNVQRLFGVSNVLKILNSVDPEDRPKAMETMQYEAEARIKDPVNGCVSIIRDLQAEIDAVTKEYEITKQQLAYCKQSEQLKQLQQQYLQQQNLQNLFAASSMPMPPFGRYEYQPQELIESANETNMIGYLSKRAASSQPFEEHVEDAKPFDEMQQTTIDRNEPEESSAESSVGRETSPLDLR